MTVTVLYFAHYQDIVGVREQARILPDGATVSALADTLARDYPKLHSLLSYARVAVNADYADADTALRDGDEVALMPPMSGGSGIRQPPEALTRLAEARHPLPHPLVPRWGEGQERTTAHDFPHPRPDLWERVAEERGGVRAFGGPPCP